MADLDRFPPHPGDKEPYLTYLKPINDELWARQWLATEKIYKETRVMHTVNSGFRPYEEQLRLYRCYTCCCCNNCNLAARPGSSNHERGFAIDFSQSPRNITRSREIYYEHGIHFPIFGPKSEPWHGEMYDGRPGIGDVPPPVLTPKRETQVALADNHVINGVTLEAEIYEFPTLVRIRWDTDTSPLWPTNGYVSMVDYLPHSPGPTPHWVNHIEVGQVPGGEKGPRFCIVCKDTASHLATAAYQEIGNQGEGIIKFDLNSNLTGHPGWWPAG